MKVFCEIYLRVAHVRFVALSRKLCLKDKRISKNDELCFSSVSMSPLITEFSQRIFYLSRYFL